MQRLLDQQYRQPSGLVGRWLGERMVRQHEPEVQWTLSLLDLAPQSHVLEIGCGAGRALELALARVREGRVSGVDYSATMVHASRKRNARALAEGKLEVIRANVAALPFAAESFDTIWSVHTLYFWPDPEQALEELARVLKAGGLLVLTFSPGQVGQSSPNPILDMVEKRMHPALQQLGFTVSIQEGPDSRHFRTQAIIGRK